MEVKFLNRYLYSPKIWLHYTNSKLKIYTMLTFLLTINHINSLHLIILLIIYVIGIRKLIISTKYLISLLATLLFSTFFYSLSYLIIKQEINLSSYLCVCIPYIIKINYILEKKRHLLNNFIIIIYSNYCLPNFIFRTYLLNILNVLVTNTLFMTTLYEDIILFIVNIKESNFYKNYIIILACSSQFLEEIIAYFYKISVISKVRSYSINISYNFILNTTNNFVHFINTYINSLSTSINLRLNTKDIQSV